MKIDVGAPAAAYRVHPIPLYIQTSADLFQNHRQVIKQL